VQQAHHENSRTFSYTEVEYAEACEQEDGAKKKQAASLSANSFLAFQPVPVAQPKHGLLKKCYLFCNKTFRFENFVMWL